MQKPTLDPEEWIVSIRDVKLLYTSIWKKLLKWAVIGGAASFIYFANTDVMFEATASFKEGKERSASQASYFREILGVESGESNPQAASIMRSNQVLRPLVEKMGLQIHPVTFRGWIQKFMHRLSEAYRAENGKLLPDIDSFQFENVSYCTQEILEFHLLFKSEKEFLVFDDKRKKLLIEASVGTPVKLGALTFTLFKPPESLKTEHFYPFVVDHWSSETEALRDLFEIENDEDNQSLINIRAGHRDRFVAKALVNELMAQYQEHLKREYDHVASQQLSYLESKQDQIFSKMESLFDQQTEYLGRNLEKSGFVGLEQESQSLLLPHQEMYNRVLSLDIELSRLNQLEREGKVISVAEDGPFSSKLTQIAQNISGLKQERDLLELSVCQGKVHSLEAKKAEIKEVRFQRLEVEKLIQEVSLGDEISYFEFNEGLSIWARAMKDPEERVDFTEYLENYARLLSIREKILQDRFFYGSSIPEELEGIDLASSKGLHLHYNGKLDEAQAKIRHLEKIREEIPKQDFNLAPLGSILTDSLSQKLINEASDFEFKIKDEKHHTQNEEKKWLEEITYIRRVLADHLEQLIVVEDLNANLFREKMAGLQKVSLDCINRNLSVLEEQGSDCIKQRKEALNLEKALLEKEMAKIRTTLANMLPEKWRFERWLEIKTGMISKIMETITEVVESKTMSTQMHHVESKPLDIALVPISPTHLKLMNKAYLGAFTLPFLIFSFAFIRRLLKGFPLSLEKLKALKLPCLGAISSFCDGPQVEKPTGLDLDLLRKISLFSEDAKVIALIGGKGPDYSYALGENLARRHAKSIVIRCDFLSTFQEKDAPGILQVWKEEIAELPIRKGKGFDYITTGGFSPFGTEIIQSENFYNLIKILKNNYDFVYLLFRSPLASAESHAALRLCDKAVVTVCSEQTEELTPFVDWGYDDNRCRLTFITRS